MSNNNPSLITPNTTDDVLELSYGVRAYFGLAGVEEPAHTMTEWFDTEENAEKYRNLVISKTRSAMKSGTLLELGDDGIDFIIRGDKILWVRVDDVDADDEDDDWGDFDD